MLPGMSRSARLVLLLLATLVTALLPARAASAADPVLSETITSPAAGAAVAGTVTITASASPDTAVVQFYVDAVDDDRDHRLDLVVVSRGVASYAWDTRGIAGPHVLFAVPLSGSRTGPASAGVPVTLTNPVATVRVVSPAEGATVGTDASFTVVVTPAAGGLAVDHVSYYVDAQVAGEQQTVRTPPYAAVLHLVPGSHVVRVAVVDSHDHLGPPSVVHLTVRARTTLTLDRAVGPAAVAGARQVAVGSVTAEDGSSVGGQRVRLEAQLAGTRSWRTVRTVLTGSGGTVRAPYSLPRSARLRLVYAGSRVWQASTSAPRTVAVAPRWSCTGSGSGPTTLRCTSSPRLAGRRVTARVDGRAVAQTTTRSDGTAVFRARAAQGRQLAVTLRGDAAYAQATSVVVVPRPAPPAPTAGGTSGRPTCTGSVVDGEFVVTCTS